MEQYEDKSNQLSILISQLSETRSKKVLQGFVYDLIAYEKSRFENNSEEKKDSSCSNNENGHDQIEKLNISSSDKDGSESTSSTATVVKQQQQSPTFFIDLCLKHIDITESSSQPNILWKIVEYIISELDYLDKILDTHQEKGKKESKKLLASASIRLEEISYLISYLQSSQKMNTNEYSELLLGINGHMKKITLKLKNSLEDNQYSNAKKYGWIEKRCGKNQSFSTWKRMWFILKDSRLAYYIKEKNLKKRSSTIGSSQEYFNKNGAENNSSNGLNNSNGVTNNNNNNSNNNFINNNSMQITDSISHVNLEGELGKKKEGKGWKVRWMKLLDHTLVYFKSIKDKEPLGIINLNECQDCEINKESSNKFVVVHANNRYYFKTNTKEELITWVKSVKDRIPSINQTDFKKMDLDQFQLKGVIEFQNILGVAETFKFNSQPNCLTITTDEKTYYLSFDSNKEKTDWLNQLNLNITKFNQTCSVKGGNNTHANQIYQQSISTPSSPSQQVKESKESNGNGSNGSPNILGSFKSTIKPWRFSSSPSHTRGSSDLTGKQVKFTENSLANSNGSTKKEEGFEYGSQILPRKSTLLGPNGGVQVSSTSGAVELSPVLLSSNGGGTSSSSSSSSSSSMNNNSTNANTTSLNDLVNESSDGEDEEDIKMMIPESLKNEMMRRSALSLSKTFKLEIFIGTNHQEVFTFVFSDSVLVDQVKAFAFKKIQSLMNLSILEYRLGIDEDTLLEVEFLKFIYSHTMVELALKTCGIVKIGIFHHRKDRRVKEKLYPEKYYAYLSNSPDGIRKFSNGIPNMELSKSEPNLQYCLQSSSPLSSPSTSPSTISTQPPQQPISLPQTTSQPIFEKSNSSGSFIKPSSSNSTTTTTTTSSINIGRSNSIISPASSPSIISSSQKNAGWQSVNPSISLNQRRQLITNCPGWNIEVVSNPNLIFTSQGYKPKFDKQEHGFYRRYNFDGSSTVQSFLGVDNKMGPLAFSLAKDANDNYRGVLHTKHGAKTISEEAKNIVGILNLLSLNKKVKTKKVVSHLINMLDPTIDSKLLNLASNQQELQKELLSFEERQTTSGFKFGMVYCRHGQVTDDEIFSNRQGSPEWEEFLSLIGDKIELVGWPHYSAGLDVKFNSTGTHSLYTDYHGNEVMFHVSTMLPFSTTDSQQIERKRQVGNDICVVVFNDGTLSYMPNTITSQFNHVVILVQYDKQNNGYKVSMACKDGVKTPFEPFSPLNLIKKQDIKDFLITKLINGELASLQAPVFASKITRTRESLLNYYISQFL